MQKVAVVGGGISGLTSAYLLNKIDYNPIVFESNLVGGRIKTVNYKKYVIDVGAQFITDFDTHAFNLCDDLGLRDKILNINTSFLYHSKDRLISFNKNNFPEIKPILSKLDEIAPVLEKIQPWDLDSDFTKLTFEQWCRKNMDDDIIDIVDSIIRPISFMDSRTSSAYYGWIVLSAMFNRCYSFKDGMEVITSISSNLNILKKEISDIRYNKKFVFINGIKFDKAIVSIPITKVANMIPELKSNIRYSCCSFFLFDIPKNLWSHSWGVLLPHNSRLCFLTDETQRFHKFTKDRTLLGVILPSMKYSVDEIVQELEKIFSLNESELSLIGSYYWEEALPICSPVFHRELNRLKQISLPNIEFCGDYMDLPSLDGAIRSAYTAVNNLDKR